MTNYDARQSLARNADRLDNVTKPIRNMVWLLALVGGLWVQFLGPGLSSALQQASGNNALKIQMEEGFTAANSRLDFIEDNMAPPKVLNWLRVRAFGPCDEDTCRKMHTFSRTLYGESCGVPKVTIEIRLSNNDKLPILSEFTPIEGTLQETRVIHDLQIEPEIPDGLHHYQFTLTYPDCTWDREPIPRYSPWFPVTVKRPT